MSTFPAAAYITNAARTEGEVKTAIDDWLATTKQIPGAGVTEATLTIASGSVTPTIGIQAIDTEAAAATDDLANIVTTNIPDGSMLLIRAANSGRVVTVKHNAGGAGQISLASGGDLQLNSTRMWLPLKRTGADWEEITHFTSDSTAHEVQLTNKVGSALAIGDVVAISTANASAVVLGDTASSRKQFVVALEAVADNAKGRFAAGGIVTVKATGATVIGNYGIKSATTKTIEDSGIAHGNTAVPPIGTLFIILSVAAGGTCQALFAGGGAAIIGVKGADIASAAALNIGEDGDYFHVTGTVGITSIESRPAGQQITLVFDGALTITHNATSLVMPNGVDLTTVAGDIVEFISEGSGNWRCSGWRLTTSPIGRKGADIASATALNLGQDGDYFHVTGTTTITSIETRPAGFEVTLEFDGALTFTHNATSLILQGSTNLTTAAGDVITLRSEGSGNWRESARRLAAASTALETGTWSDVTGSRALGTVYQNTSGKKRRVSVRVLGAANDEAGLTIAVGSANPPTLGDLDVTIINQATGGGLQHQVSSYAEVPSNWYYKATGQISTETLSKWFELDE